MSALPLILILAWALPVVAGYLLVAHCRTLSSGERMALGLLTGYGVLVFLLSWAGAFAGSRLYAWVMFLLVVGGFLLNGRARMQLVSDLREQLRKPWIVAAGFVSVVLALYLNIYNFLPGAPLFFESDSNHDCFNWVIAADVLRTSGYLFPKVSGNVGTDVFYGFSGLWGFDGRLGSELFLSWISVLSGARPALAFNTFVSSLYVGWVAAVWMLARRLRGGAGLPPWTLLLIVCTQPAFVFFVRFGNIPNLLGVIVSAGWMAWGFLVFEGRLQSRWLPLVAAATGLSASLAVYPEMLPFLISAYVVAMGLWVLRSPIKQGWRLLGFHLIGLATLGALLNPLSTIRGIGTVWLKSSVVGDFPGLPNLFESTPMAVWIPSWVAIDRTAGHYLGILLGAIVTLALCALVLRALLRSDRLEILLMGFLVACPLLLLASFQGVGYLNQKAIQYPTALVYAALAAGMVGGWDAGVRLGRRLPWVIASVISAVFLFVSMGRSAYQAQTVIPSKAISGDVFEMGTSVVPQIADREVLILDASFERSFFYAAWLPYAMQASRTSFPPSPQQPRWHREPWPFLQDRPSPEYLVSSSAPANRLFALDEEPMYRNAHLSLHRNPFGRMETEGLLLRQADRIPIAPQGCEISIEKGLGWKLETVIQVDRLEMPVTLEIFNHGKASEVTTQGGMLRFETPLGSKGGTSFKIVDPSGVARMALTELVFAQTARVVPARIEGLYAKEPDRIWMSARASVEPQDGSVGRTWLNLRVMDRFRGIPELSELLVMESGGKPLPLDEDALRKGISIEIGSGRGATLVSSGGAVSPAQMGWSEDKRPLSYAFSVFELTSAPWFEAVAPDELEVSDPGN